MKTAGARGAGLKTTDLRGSHVSPRQSPRSTPVAWMRIPSPGAPVDRRVDATRLPQEIGASGPCRPVTDGQTEPFDCAT